MEKGRRETCERTKLAQALKSQPDDTVLLGYITKAECVEFSKGNYTILSISD
jgi:hypothetical protein